MSKRPIEPQDFLYGVKVVDIGDIRVARGKTRVPKQACAHASLAYDDAERRIYCRDCESDVDAFDAFLQLVQQHDAAWKSLRRAQTEIKEAAQHQLRSRAAKTMDDYWRSRKTAPNCPHCNEALLPEDVAGKRLSSSSLELSRQKRKKKQQP